MHASSGAPRVLFNLICTYVEGDDGIPNTCAWSAKANREGIAGDTADSPNHCVITGCHLICLTHPPIHLTLIVHLSIYAPKKFSPQVHPNNLLPTNVPVNLYINPSTYPVTQFSYQKRLSAYLHTCLHFWLFVHNYLFLYLCYIYPSKWQKWGEFILINFCLVLEKVPQTLRWIQRPYFIGSSGALRTATIGTMFSMSLPKPALALEKSHVRNRNKHPQRPPRCLIIEYYTVDTFLWVGWSRDFAQASDAHAIRT